MCLTALVGEKVCIDIKGSLNWSVGHDLSLYLLHSFRDAVGSAAIVLVLVEGVRGVVSLVKWLDRTSYNGLSEQRTLFYEGHGINQYW